MEVADETIANDNHDTWSSGKISTSESDVEEDENRPGTGDPSTGNDNEKSCNGDTGEQLIEPQPWVPTMSLLDLAHRLKQAEMRVLGLMQKNAAQLDEPCSDDSMESFSAEKQCLFSDENSKLGRFDTPKSTENSTSSAQKGNVLSQFLGIKTENLSDSNMDDSAFDQSKTTEFSSPCENSNFDAYKRHQCAWCNYKTDSKSHLLRHQKTVHQLGEGCDVALSLITSFEKSANMEAGKANTNSRSLRRHRCELCSYQTDSKSHLRRHQGSVHSTKKPYRCHLCRMEFSRSEKAKEHFMNLHSDVPYDSRKMRKFMPMTKEPNKAAVDTFTKIKLLYKDLDASAEKSANNGTRTLKREIKDVGNDDDDDDHDKMSISELQEKHRSFGSPSDGSKPYMCLKCDYASRDIWHLKRHISDVHLMRKDFKCKICTYATNRQHRFICHMRTHGEIFCFYCDYSNIKLDVFKQHLQLCSALHKMATDVQCRLCEIDCKEHGALKEHMSTVHGAVLYSCDECSYYSEILEDFDSHAQIHREEERTCKLCNVVFETKQDLHLHCNAVHIWMGDNRLPTCVVCQRQEPDWCAMYEHVHQHTPQAFLCTASDCSFKSTTSKSLVLHSKYYHNKNQADVAMGAREPQPGPSSSAIRLRDTSMLKSAALGTYSCPICTERPPFRYRKSFQKHMTQHAVESESCPLCQDTFFLHKELQEHALSIHGVKVV